MRWQANNWETKTSMQTKALLPNQDKKRAACFVTLTRKAFFILVGVRTCASHTDTHLCSHICQISQCSNRPPGTTDLATKHTIMPFLISAREDLKRKWGKTHFPNKEGEKLRAKEFSEWAMKTGMGSGIKEKDAQQIRAAEIWSCTFFLSFIPSCFLATDEHTATPSREEWNNNITNKLEIKWTWPRTRQHNQHPQKLWHHKPSVFSLSTTLQPPPFTFP